MYSYKVNRKELNDDQLKSLGKAGKILSEYSAEEFKKFYCADCVFPSGDIYPLEPKALIF